LNKKDLMQIVNHYANNEEFETAKRFIHNFPMKSVDREKEIKRIDKLKKEARKPVKKVKDWRPNLKD
jgi:hypothetical protein